MYLYLYLYLIKRIWPQPWRRAGDKPLYEPMMFSLLMHIYASLGPNELNTATKLLNLRENRHPRAKANAHVAQRVNIT